ncbi:hypothetical protein ACFWY9_01525 [Amycolatopsis sp. NPDC059027]|uniref:hypothetical protein n=1 Tax=unclassified Amycolatopsis TaxID=2618356 RepID=UPI00366EEAE8
MPDTEVLPALLPDGVRREVYTLRRDRCVIETSLRLLRFPVLRGRFSASGGHFDVAEPELTVVLDAASLRVGVPFLSRFLTGPRGLSTADHPDVVVEAPVVLLGADRVVDLVCRVVLPGTTRDLRLRGDLRYVDDERIILWAKGILPKTRRKARFARRRVHVEIAMEFVR